MQPESPKRGQDPARTARMRRILRKYISPDLLKSVREAADQGLDYIPNRRTTLTYLFADLVSFTSWAENRTPDETVHMLNLSIGATSAVILHWGGSVNKFMGDSLFATFENPVNAVCAGIEMQKQFQILNLIGMKEDSTEIRVRIGIHTGPCILASIGTDEFMDYTAIGDSVNIASRLEKACRPGAVIISQATGNLMQDHILLSHPVTVEAKGKSTPLEALYVDRIRYSGPRGTIETGIDDDLF